MLHSSVCFLVLFCIFAKVHLLAFGFLSLNSVDPSRWGEWIPLVPCRALSHLRLEGVGVRRAAAPLACGLSRSARPTGWPQALNNAARGKPRFSAWASLGFVFCFPRRCGFPAGVAPLRGGHIISFASFIATAWRLDFESLCPTWKDSPKQQGGDRREGSGGKVTERRQRFLLHGDAHKQASGRRPWGSARSRVCSPFRRLPSFHGDSPGNVFMALQAGGFL